MPLYYPLTDTSCTAFGFLLELYDGFKLGRGSSAAFIFFGLHRCCIEIGYRWRLFTELIAGGRRNGTAAKLSSSLLRPIYISLHALEMKDRALIARILQCATRQEVGFHGKWNRDECFAVHRDVYPRYKHLRLCRRTTYSVQIFALACRTWISRRNVVEDAGHSGRDRRRLAGIR